MNAAAIAGRLERFPPVLEAAVAGLSPEEARLKPPSGAWSILEIVNHLADEEVQDFRTRLDLTLRNDGTPWPPIDPEAWARERRYNERDLAGSVERFVRERRESIRWLRSLGERDWSAAYTHPRAGPITAGSLLGAWAAHDALHLRQIAKRLYELAARDAGPHEIGYAGEWRA